MSSLIRKPPTVQGDGHVRLSERQRRSLEAICDTFAPGGDGLPSASELGVPDAILDALALNPRKAERRQVAQLLGLWDTAPLTALGGGGFKRFSGLTQEERERVLLSWCDSRVPQRRAAFEALRKAALLTYHMLPGPNGSRSPVWERMGYPGPLGAPEDPPPPGIKPISITEDTTLDCDVCVVGSGAGGGVAAAVLAAAGLDVVVLEAGDYYTEADFDGGELSGFSRLYLQGGSLASPDQSVGLLAGSCLGGGTVVNFAYCFRTPDDVREEWARLGVPEVGSEEYDRSLDAVWTRLGVNQEHNEPSTRDRVMHRGLDELGWHVDSIPRNVNACRAEVCGFCGWGCPLGSKQSTMKTWLQDAHDAGARVVVRARAERALTEYGAARGVEARTADGHRVTVRARAVVVACGAIQTPALLRRSGLSNPNVGRNLRLHPATGIWGVFEEELRPWEGMTGTVYSDEHRYLDQGYGVKYEHIPCHPYLYVAYGPWRGARMYAEYMQGISHTIPVGVLLRDRDGGEVRVARDGHPVVHYKLSDYDRRHMRKGVEGAARLLEAAGARKIISGHTKGVTYEPGRDGGVQRFMHDADAAGYDAGRLLVHSFHIMGSARMGGSPDMSACNPRGETWEVRDLYVLDGSAFPTASGVNPMVTIESIAHMNASRLAAQLT